MTNEEKAISWDILQAIINPAMGLPTDDLKIVLVNSDHYKNIPIETWALGFKIDSNITRERGRKMLKQAVVHTGLQRFHVEIKDQKVHRTYGYDTLVIRSIEYKISDDMEDVHYRALFLNKDKPVSFDLQE